MMRKIVVLVLGSIVVVQMNADQKKETVTMADLSGRTDLKMKYIDSLDAMQKSDEGKEVSKELEKKRQQLGQEIQAQEKVYAQAANDYKTKSTTMNDLARAKAEREMHKLEDDYKTKVQESEYELKLAMQKATEELLKEVEEAAQIIAQRENLDVVIDARSGQPIYVADKVMVTGDLVKEMNKKRDIKLAQAKTPAVPQSGLKVAAQQNKDKKVAPAA